MQSLFHPKLDFGFIHALISSPQAPEVLATVPEIQKLSGIRPPVGFEIPNPGNPIPQHQFLLGSPQTPSQSLPMQSPPQVGRIALGAHHRFAGDHSTAPFSSARLLLQIKHAVLYFVPFYALFVGFLLSPARPTKTRKPPVDHQQGQFRALPLWIALPGHLLEPLLGLNLGLAARSLHQRMNDRIVNLTTPFARHLRRRLIGTAQRHREGQFLLQHRAHLLVCPQAPPFSQRTAPMLIPWVLTVPHLQPDGAHDASQTHRLLSPVLNLSVAQGEKLRLGGWLLPGASVPVVGASIRALLLILPALCRAESAADHYPRSLVLSYS